jgi:hypothetical protein
VDALKQRIHHLENIAQRKRRQITNDDCDSTVTPSLPVEGHDGLDSSVQTAMGEIGFLSRSAMAEPRDDTSGFPRQLAMSQMLQAILSLSGASPSQNHSVDAYASQWSLLGVPADGAGTQGDMHRIDPAAQDDWSDWYGQYWAHGG